MELTNARFENIRGYDYPKREAMQLANFFKNYDLYTRNGAHLPKGILFYGIPGTGKSLFANAIINESGANKFYLTTDEFYKENKIGASIQAIFEKARKEAPSIILIDEIDRIVSCNRYNNPETPDQREALRCLLTEIDKIQDEAVLVIATANEKLRLLPAALVRSGRLEKHIEICAPDKQERKEILSYYLAKSDVFKNINPEMIASYTKEFTGSALERLVNDVLIDCIAKDKLADFGDFIEPIEVIRTSGIQKPKSKDNTVTIYHELGHFIADYVLNDTIGMINLTPHADTGGRYTKVDKNDDNTDDLSLTKMTNECVVGISGLVATKIFFGEPYLGASSDIGKISNIYINMVTSGMRSNKEAAIYLLYKDEYQPLKDYNSELATCFAQFLDECERKAYTIINNNKPIIDILFKELKDKYYLTQDEITELIKDIPVVK